MDEINKTKNGFTIVELLIVIIVVAILAAITIVAYNGIQQRARDARRAQDFSNIKKSLRAYEARHNGMPRTHGVGAYTTITYGGWDASSSSSWLAFLRTEFGNSAAPVDPINTLDVANNPPATTNRLYFYYCYAQGTGGYPAITSDYVRVGYTRDNGTTVAENLPTTCI